LTQTRKPEDCVRCGKCLTYCPTYRFFLREDFSPRGRNVLLSQGLAGEGLAYCLLCGRCERVCPLGVSFPKGYLQSLVKGKGLNTFLPPIKDLLFWKDFTQKDEASFLDERVFSSKEGEFYLYLSCGLKHLYPKALVNFSALLKKEGLKVHVPQANCCGILYLSLKDFGRLKEFAQNNLLAFSEEKPILTFCATCLWMFREVYPLISEDFRSLAERTYFVLDFLVRNFKVKVEIEGFGKVLFHKPCHLVGEGLANIDLTLSNLGLNNKIKDFCCGSGKVDLRLKGFQRAYRRAWLRELSSVDVLATACTGCFYNFSSLLKAPPLVKHWLEVISLKQHG
jgi:glycolate oxidase iron-sulfur subunit